MIKSQKGVLMIPVLFVILIIGTIGFIVYKNLTPEKIDQKPTIITDLSSNTPSPTAIDEDEKSNLSSNTPTPIIINEGDWKIYKNTTHKYSVRYPSNWIIDAYEANNEEDYQDSICCNTAYLKISNEGAEWILSINMLYTGFDAPDDCQTENSCSYTYDAIRVMDKNLERVLVRKASTNDLVEAYLRDPDNPKGFGKIGFDTAYITADHIKYFIDYKGENVDLYLNVLDEMTESLQKI